MLSKAIGQWVNPFQNPFNLIRTSSTTSKNEKNQIPEFIRNFGFEDLIDEIKPKIISKEESYTEFSEDDFEDIEPIEILSLIHI